VVSAFWPLGGEIDLRPLMHALHARGHAVVLPITPKRGLPLTFGLWRPGDVLVAERFGTFRPIGPVLVPDFLLVPLLAFDRAGGRLGYGGGFYDRTLALRDPKPLCIGVGFEIGRLPTIHPLPHDITMDRIVTEASPP
jgi:5-formyltetrahydrofolate cyclo-ligase